MTSKQRMVSKPKEETMEDLRAVNAGLREETALLRGVLDVLRVDLQIKDDQIDKLYQSLRTLRAYPPSSPPSKACLPPAIPSLSLVNSTQIDEEVVSKPQQSIIRDGPSLVQVLSDDMLSHVLTFLDIASNIGSRRVCKRFAHISSQGMPKYWETAWRDVKGVVPTSRSARPSSTLWKQEFKWSHLGSRPVVTTLTGHKGSVTSLAFAEYNDRELLVSGSDDGSLIVWCTNEDKQREDDARPAVIMQHHHRQSKGENVARLHSLSGHHGPVWGVSVDQKIVCSGSFDKTVKIWDLGSGNCLHTLRGHENWVSCVSLKDNTIISGSWDSTVRLWRINGSEARHMGNLPTEAGNAVYSLDRRGKFVVTGSHCRRFELFDIEAGRLLTRQEDAHAGKIYAVHFQSDHVFATGGCDGKARIWDARSPSEGASVTISAHGKPVLGVRMGDPNASPYRLATCSMDYLVKVFDIRMAGSPVQDIPGWMSLRGRKSSGETTLHAHSDSVFALCMDESKICSGSADGAIKVFRH